VVQTLKAERIRKRKSRKKKKKEENLWLTEHLQKTQYLVLMWAPAMSETHLFLLWQRENILTPTLTKLFICNNVNVGLLFHIFSLSFSFPFQIYQDLFQISLPVNPHESYHILS
jgi:hypothetical protein